MEITPQQYHRNTAHNRLNVEEQSEFTADRVTDLAGLFFALLFSVGIIIGKSDSENIQTKVVGAFVSCASVGLFICVRWVIDRSLR